MYLKFLIKEEGFDIRIFVFVSKLFNKCSILICILFVLIKRRIILFLKMMWEKW